MNWWEMSNQISCISCKTVNNANENNSSFSCAECGEEQIVADTCCDEPSSNKRFAVRINELETECPTCKSEMIKLPCCDQFRQKSIIDDNIYNCKVCEKHSIGCVCKVINKLPPKAKSWKCSRLKCHHFTICFSFELASLLVWLHLSKFLSFHRNRFFVFTLQCATNFENCNVFYRTFFFFFFCMT